MVPHTTLDDFWSMILIFSLSNTQQGRFNKYPISGEDCSCYRCTDYWGPENGKFVTIQSEPNPDVSTGFRYIQFVALAMVNDSDCTLVIVPGQV
jgi:hypothetical protein